MTRPNPPIESSTNMTHQAKARTSDFVECFPKFDQPEMSAKKDRDTPNPQPPNPQAKPTQEPRLKRSASPRDKRMMPGHYLRSGGPNSREGKARSSQNSVRHGGYVSPSSDSEKLALIEQGLRKQFHPQTPHQDLLVKELARAHHGIALMGDLMLENLECCVALPPNALALSARVDYPWPDHASELIDPPDALVLQRELGRLLLKQLGEHLVTRPNPEPHAEPHSHNTPQAHAQPNSLPIPQPGPHPRRSKRLTGVPKLLRDAAERLLSPQPLVRDEAPGLWRQVDRLMRPRSRPESLALASASPLLEAPKGLALLARPKHSSTGLTLERHAAPQRNGRVQVTGVQVTDVQPTDPQATHGAPGQANSPVEESALRLYWLFMNHRRVTLERAMMVNERRMSMITDSNVNRAQAQHMRRVIGLERQLLESELDPWTRHRLS